MKSLLCVKRKTSGTGGGLGLMCPGLRPKSFRVGKAISVEGLKSWDLSYCKKKFNLKQESNTTDLRKF